MLRGFKAACDPASPELDRTGNCAPSASMRIRFSVRIAIGIARCSHNGQMHDACMVRYVDLSRPPLGFNFFETGPANASSMLSDVRENGRAPTDRGSAYPRLHDSCLVVLKLRHTFQGFLGRTTENGMVRVPFTFRRGCRRRYSGTICGSIQPRTGRCRRRGANGFVDEFELAHLKFD